MKISLIIPVFNAETTLPLALQSLNEQTYRDFEVVFVNDGSTDRTADLLDNFAAKSDIPCQIVHQENQGVAAARNRGLDVASGEYIGFVDADDTLMPHAIETAIAVSDGTDIIGWDWTLGFGRNARLMRQADYETPLQALKNLMGGTMRWNLWLFLLRRELIVKHNIRFIHGADMGEDMQFTIKAFCAADRVVQLHDALYCYNALSESSLSRKFSDRRRREIETNLDAASKAVSCSTYAEILKPSLYDLKLFLKRPLLISKERSNYECWFGWFPEANAYAMNNKALPFRIRLLQGMAAHRLWTGVKLYYVLVHKFVYGILYR